LGADVSIDQAADPLSCAAMKNKNVIRVLVLAAVFAWPAVEAYRYHLAKKEVVASAERLNAVSVKYASLKSVQVADQASPEKKP
jgi:hypothetical protein